MCLSSVFKEKPTGAEPLCKNIAKVEINGDSLVFTDIMGKTTVISAQIINIDLMENVIRIRENKIK